MSDNIVWEYEGIKRWIPAQEPTHNYARNTDLPLFRESGKPKAEGWGGIFDKLALVKTQIHFGAGFRSIRILPFSGMCASHLANDKKFNNWDKTHATNSGVFNYQIPNPLDERFPINGWHDCISDIIDNGWIGEEILPCDHILRTPDGKPILIGGHDTTFANALHTPYSTKPYVSAGTWITASVESSLRPNWNDEGARYITAPNGAILKQICFAAPTNEAGREKAASRIIKFFEKNLAEGTTMPIPVFGGWRQTFFEKI